MALVFLNVAVLYLAGILQGGDAPAYKDLIIFGFALTLGGLVFWGVPSHYYLRRKGKNQLKDYLVAGLLGGILICIVIVGRRSSLAHFIEDFPGMSVTTLFMYLPVGSACASVAASFWALQISRQKNHILIALTCQAAVIALWISLFIYSLGTLD